MVTVTCCIHVGNRPATKLGGSRHACSLRNCRYSFEELMMESQQSAQKASDTRRKEESEYDASEIAVARANDRATK